jgi:concanavalin A-like lectin/glucanase superfamily protein
VDKVLACLLALLLVASPAWAARQFNGTDQSLQSAATVDLTAFNKLTVAFWLYKDSWADSDRLALELGADSTTDGEFQVNPEFSPTSTFAVTLRGASSTGDRETITRPTGNGPHGDPWHHYVVVFDLTASPTPGARHITNIYVDGVDQTLTDSLLLYNSGVLLFANSIWNVMSRNNASLFTPGRFAELGIWGGINFTQTDVDALYASGTGADATTVQGASLNNYWHLCGTSGASTEPATTGGVDMTVHGATFVAHPISGMCGAGGYILTEIADCINAENADRLITEDATAGVGPCVTTAAAPPMRTLMGVGQ